MQGAGATPPTRLARLGAWMARNKHLPARLRVMAHQLRMRRMLADARTRLARAIAEKESIAHRLEIETKKHEHLFESEKQYWLSYMAKNGMDQDSFSFDLRAYYTHDKRGKATSRAIGKTSGEMEYLKTTLCVVEETIERLETRITAMCRFGEEAERSIYNE